MAASDLDQVIEEYHQALDTLMQGSPEGYTRLFSRRDDVTLANPFGPAVRGWEQVARTAQRAASHYRDGEAVGFERIATCVTPELAYILELERARARVAGGQEIVRVSFRVTTIFRREDGNWKVVHRHSDPITTRRSAETVVQSEGATVTSARS